MKKFNFDKEKFNLYFHGSYAYFENFDISLVDPFSDFGQGLYLTKDYDRAVDRAIKGSVFTGEGYVYYYLVPKKFDSTFKVKYFRGSSIEWSKYIVSNREGKVVNNFYNPDYDLVIGCTADAKPSFVINEHKKDLNRGLISETVFYERVSKDLKPFVLPIQYCLKSYRAIKETSKLYCERVI